MMITGRLMGAATNVFRVAACLPYDQPHRVFDRLNRQPASWPLRTREIDLAKLRSIRGALFAEALELYRAGERWCGPR